VAKGTAGADPDDTGTVRAFLDEHPRPLVVLGALTDPSDQANTRDFCRALGAPVLAEASSHSWGALHGLILEGREASAQVLIRSGRVGSVLRIGDVPSFRVWRDLEVRSHVPVLSVSRRCWPGLTRGRLIQVPAGQSFPFPEPGTARVWPVAEAEEVFVEDRARWRRIAALLAECPASEAGLVARLSRAIPRHSSVYLGNSLPIREWNQFAALEDRSFMMRENRGVNGIDGQLSTFLGAADPGRENWAVVGDLTALYDLQAPWALRHCAGITTRIVVINNGGGRIFGRLFENPNFQNRHQTSFEGWAAMWSMAWNQDLATPVDEQAAVIELRPDEAQTTAFWAAWSALRST
jgi:2-succinyl-5-enolpyruvyl-6-hydroxy-3-cyclohexene-1-carboxylate synthase